MYVKCMSFSSLVVTVDTLQDSTYTSHLADLHYILLLFTYLYSNCIWPQSTFTKVKPDGATDICP